MSQPGFWDDTQKSSKVLQQLKALKAAVEPWQNISRKYQELKELAAILRDQDKELFSELNRNLDTLSL